MKFNRILMLCMYVFLMCLSASCDQTPTLENPQAISYKNKHNELGIIILHSILSIQAIKRSKLLLSPLMIKIIRNYSMTLSLLLLLVVFLQKF